MRILSTGENYARQVIHSKIKPKKESFKTFMKFETIEKQAMKMKKKMYTFSHII